MTAPASIRDPLIGARIDGRYLVHGVLGRGGMGVVYDGEHEQLGRPVAIKVLGPGVAGDPVAVQRFLREARTASRLTHGNIVDVSDLGNLPDGRPYLVMPKLQGVDLCTLLQRQGPQTPRRTCELLRGAAAALDLIHAKGFVHRDVKPENLMHVVHDDGSEAVLLLDFGIVGLISPDSARLTAEGVVFGTPAYISPEVVRGDAPGPRSDTYALATVAFELITGQTPFRAANVMQLLQLKLGNDAPSMSQVAGHAIPDEIEAVLRQSLARDPRARHASAGAFVAALEDALKRTADPSPRGERLDTQARQRLQDGTGELELSLSDLPPPTAANDAADAPANPPPAAPPVRQSSEERGAATRTAATTERPARVRAGAGVFAVALLALAGWALTHGDGEAPRPHVVSPLPAATNRAGAELAAPQTAQPVPQGSAAPPPAPPARQEPQAKPPPTAASTTRIKPRVEAPTPASTPQTAPPSAANLIEQAQTELVQGHLILSADLYERATRTDPGSAAAFRGLGLVSERLGRKQDAIRALRRAISLAPDDPKNALLEARVHRLEGP